MAALLPQLRLPLHRANDRLESLPLQVDANDRRRTVSAIAPLKLGHGEASETLSFRMTEPG